MRTGLTAGHRAAACWFRRSSAPREPDQQLLVQVVLEPPLRTAPPPVSMEDQPDEKKTPVTIVRPFAIATNQQALVPCYNTVCSAPLVVTCRTACEVHGGVEVQPAAPWSTVWCHAGDRFPRRRQDNAGQLHPEREPWQEGRCTRFYIPLPTPSLPHLPTASPHSDRNAWLGA